VHTSLLIEAATLPFAVPVSSGKSPQHLSEVCVERIEQHGLSPFLRFDFRLNLTALDWSFHANQKPQLWSWGFFEKL
jgi:hypothetical protein